MEDIAAAVHSFDGAFVLVPNRRPDLTSTVSRLGVEPFRQRGQKHNIGPLAKRLPQRLLLVNLAGEEFWFAWKAEPGVILYGNRYFE